MLRPRIKRTTEPIGSPDGDLYLMRPSAGSDIRIEKPDAEERQLLAALDGEHTRERAGGAVRRGGRRRPDRPAAGAGAGRGRGRRRPDRRRRAGRASIASSATSATSTHRADAVASARQRLREREAWPCSGSAASAAGRRWSLACCGVGEMLLIDGDRVEDSNLNRQILYTEADIGRLKVEAAAERLRAFNSAMRIELDRASGWRARPRSPTSSTAPTS